MTTRKQTLLFIAVGICIGTGLYLGVIHAGKKQNPKPDHITDIPTVTSCIDLIKVHEAHFNRLLDPSLLVLQIRNDSDSAVVAISIETKSKKNHIGYRVVTNSFEYDEPKVLIEPHNFAEFPIEVANIKQDASVEVGSVVFADGTEAGCKGSIKMMHETKKVHEANKAAKKASKAPK